MAELGKVGWIFDGGGFLCAHGVGMAEACWQAGIRPDYIQAVSGGVFSGAKITESQNFDELKRLWLETEAGGAGKIFNFWEGLRNFSRKNSDSLFTNKGILKLLNYIDFKRLRQSPVDFEVVVNNESRGDQTEFFSNSHVRMSNEESARNCLYATTALPGFLPPAIINGDCYSDGLNFDIRRALDKGCQTIFIFVSVPPNASAIESASLRWYLRMRRCLRTTIRKSMEWQIKTLLKECRDLYIHPHPNMSPSIAKLQKRFRRRRYKRRCIIYLNPLESIPTLELINFKMGDIKKAIAHGYYIAHKVASPLL